MAAPVEANGITVVRRGKTILKDVSLAVGERDFVTIIGPNGAGKSTLLKCLMGVCLPDRGTLTRRKGLKIGYVPQRFVLERTMPISARRFLHLHKRTDGAAVAAVAREVGVETALDHPLNTLSGGELQRILLARALLGGPELLVLDEPAQNLDVSGQLAFYRLIERVYNEHGLSVLMVSHDLHIVMASTRRVVCLFHHICCSGEPHAVAQDPEFLALFGDDAAKLMAIYQHSHDHRHRDD